MLYVYLFSCITSIEKRWKMDVIYRFPGDSGECLGLLLQEMHWGRWVAHRAEGESIRKAKTRALSKISAIRDGNKQTNKHKNILTHVHTTKIESWRLSEEPGWHRLMVLSELFSLRKKQQTESVWIDNNWLSRTTVWNISMYIIPSCLNWQLNWQATGCLINAVWSPMNHLKDPQIPNRSKSHTAELAQLNFVPQGPKLE